MDAEKAYEKYLKKFEQVLGISATYTHQLNDIGQSTFGSQKFNGVFTIDRIPQDFTSIIANLDTMEEPGSHWVAFAKTSNGKYMMYDSFARPTDEIVRGAQHTKKVGIVQTEMDAEQKDHEQNCGARCLAWLMVFHRHGEKAAWKI